MRAIRYQVKSEQNVQQDPIPKQLKSVAAIPANSDNKALKYVLDELYVFCQHFSNEMRHITESQAKEINKVKTALRKFVKGKRFAIKRRLQVGERAGT